MIFTLLLSILSQTSALAAPMIGYATPEPENKYQILNIKGEKLFSATTDTIKRVELRDGFAVIQTIANSVTVLREDGTKVIENVFGTEIRISKKLIAIYLKNGLGAVYTLEGEKVFPLNAQANRPVKEIQISNNRFALTDYFTDSFKVFDAKGNELRQFRAIKKAMISDGFLSLTSTLDTNMLYGETFDDLLSTDSNISGLKISDEFAGYFDYYGNFRLFSRQKGEFPLQNNVSDFSLTNYYAIVKSTTGTSLLAKDQSELEFLGNMIQSTVTSHANFAYRGNTGAVWVKNEVSGDSMVVNQADSFQMTDDLLLTRNGMGEFRLYSLKTGTFGQLLYSTLNAQIVQTELGNGVVSFQTGFFNSAFYQTTIFGFNDNSVRASLVDDIRINRVNLSVNREEWNWQ